MSGEKQALSYDCVLDGCPVRIRPMREEDVPMAARLEASAFSQPWSEASLLAVLKQENALYVVAETQDRIVGLCGVINACGDGDVGNVSVEQTLRGKGLGTEMLRQLMRWGRTIGVEQYTLEVRVGNHAAIHVYEKLGFVGGGVRPGFYEKPREDALIMWKRQETVG